MELTKKYTAYDCFHGNGPYGKVLTKNESIRMLKINRKTTMPFSVDFLAYMYL